MSNETTSCINHSDRPLRVLMLGTFGIRPKGTMSARAAGIGSALLKRGHEVQIVTVPWDSPGDAGTEMSVEDVTVINTSVVRPRFWPIAVAQIIGHARRFRPDVIHLFKPKGFGDLAARYLRTHGAPVVVDMDDWEGSRGWNDVLPYSNLQRRLFDWQERTWPGKADGITVASQALQQYALELGATPDRILYLPNHLTRTRYEELTRQPPAVAGSYPQLSTESGLKVLLYTRFVEFEPSFVIHVLAKLISRVPDARLVIAGTSATGEAERSLIELADRQGLSDHIDLLGWIDSDDLRWITNQCDVAFVPFDDTLINRAKCSVKLLELLACGIPVVASNVGENREYINRHGGGLLARPGDAAHHAGRILEYLDVQNRNNRDSATTINRSSASPLWDDAVESLQELYDIATTRVKDSSTRIPIS